MTTASPPAQPSATGRWRDGIDLNELRAVWRFHGVWGPGMLVLRNLTLVWKAVVIFALMALPIGLVGFGYLKNMSDRLQEVDQQLACVDGLQALSRASLAMREARFRSVRAGLGLAPDADVGASLVAEASAWKDLQANPLLAQGDVRPVWAVFNQVRATSLAHLAQRKPFVASVPGKAEEDYRHAAGHLVKVLLDAGSGGALPDRGLRALMAGRWSEADAMRRAWRDQVVATLVRQPRPCAIFSHFVAINVAVGAALGDDRATLFSPANGSITVLESDGRTLTLIEKGREAETVVR